MRALAWISAFIQSGEVKHDERGAAFVEYVVLVAFVVAAFAAVALTMGDTLVAKLATTINSI